MHLSMAIRHVSLGQTFADKWRGTMNQLKTVVLLSLLGGLFIVIGAMIGGRRNGALLALGFACFS